MTRSVTITVGPFELMAELNDSAAADAIWHALPISAAGNTWGEEIYFRVPVQAECEDLCEVVDFGDLAF